MKKSEKDALKQKIQSENILVRRLGTVSYTHLDVYKRQHWNM